MTVYKTLSINETRNLLDKQGTHIIDIRDEVTFRQGHLPKAQHLTRDTLLEFLTTMPKEQHYIVYCYRGNSSKEVAQIMCNHGFEHVYNLEGGFNAWYEAALSKPDFEVELDA